MLPFDNRPWAKGLARTVIGLSIVAAIVAAYYFYNMGELHIPEVVIILLLLLTIIPPNVTILFRKNTVNEPSGVAMNTRLHPR